MSSLRKCSRSACTRQAVTTLTYVYAESTAVLGPLAVYAEPHSYDLCNQHAEGLTAPRGWEIIRLTPEEEAANPSPSHDDLEALANAVREAAQSRRGDGRYDDSRAEPAASSGAAPRPGKRGHLRVLRDPES